MKELKKIEKTLPKNMEQFIKLASKDPNAAALIDQIKENLDYEN